jgi:hypothetical protein
MRGKNFTEYEAQTKSMTKKLIENFFPEELPLFEFVWIRFWHKVLQLENKDPREWQIEDLQEEPSGVFSYPSHSANQEVKAILMTTAGICAELIAAERNLDQSEVEEIVNAHIKKHSPPVLAYKGILSAFIDIVDTTDFFPEPEMGEIQSPLPLEEEKKEYKVYSHENSSNPMFQSKSYVEKLETLNEDAMAQRFEIFYFPDKKKLNINGERVPIFKPGKKTSEHIPKALTLFLRNVGRSIGFDIVGEKVWGRDLRPDNEENIKQLRKRIGIVTKRVTNKYIIADMAERRIFILDTDNNERKLKYCLIERKKMDED